MRILHLLASPAFSGPADTLYRLALAQRALGHDVAVAVDRKRTHLTSEELAVPRFASAGLLDEGGLSLSVKTTPFEFLRDLRNLHARTLDVVHAHFTHDHLLARLGRPRGCTLVRSVHAPRSLRRSLPAADAFTVPAERLLVRVRRSPSRVLPAIVGPEFTPPASRDALRTELGLAGAPLFGMVSTFQPTRRHDLALDAFAQVHARRPDARLVLVGDGALGPAIRDQVARLGLGDAVHFTGYLQGEAFVRVLQALDEVWVLGLGNDFSARAAAQARACGVRVVAVDEGALPAWADVLVGAMAEELAAAAGKPDRRQVSLPTPAAIAQDVLALYEEARRR